MSKRVETFAQLVPVRDTKFGVDARQLHKALQVQDHFRTWIKRRIEKYRFIEDSDFRANLRETSEQGGRPALEYAITIGMAKELCMVENNELGRKARHYFIRCEEELKQQKQEEQRKLPQNYLEALQALVITEEQRQKERERNKVLQDENDALDTENQQLKVETGKHPDFHRLIEDLWIVQTFSHKVYGQIGRMLKALSEGLELPTYTIHHRYEHRKKVLAYHKDAYKAFRDYCRHNPDYLAKWRID